MVQRMLERIRGWFGDVRLRELPLVLSLSFLGARLVLLLSSDDLTSFGRIIGYGVRVGIQAEKRSGIYYLALAAFAAVFMLAAFAARRLRPVLFEGPRAAALAGGRELLFELSLLLLVQSVFSFESAFDKDAYDFTPALALMLLVLCLVLLGHMLWTARGIRPLAAEQAADADLALYRLLLPVPFVVLAQTLLLGDYSGTVRLLSPLSAVLYVLFYVLCGAVCGRVKNTGRLVLASVPLFLIPAGLPAGVELHYTLYVHTGVSVPPLYTTLLFMGAACLVAAVLWLLCRRYAKGPGRALGVVLPVLLLSLTLVKTHMSIYEPGYTDFIHLGNYMVPAQQFVQYGKIPFLDYWGGQWLPLSAMLYMWVNGAATVDAAVWSNMYISAVGMLAAWFILKTLLPRRWTFLALLFLPLYQIANPYYLLALLPLAYLPRLLEKRRWVDYLILWALALLGFVWMPSVGKVSITATLVVCLVTLRGKRDVINLLKGVIPVFAIPGAAYLGLCLVRGYSIADQLTLIRAFAQVDFAAGGTYLNFPDTPSWQILLMYCLFPAFGVGMLLYQFFKKKDGQRGFALVFIAVASIVSGLRGLAGHSLIDGFFYDFYLLLIVVAVFVLAPLSMRRKTAMFTLLCMLFALFIPLHSFLPITDKMQYFNKDTRHEAVAEGFENFELTRFEETTRIKLPNDAANLKALLDHYLTEGQTYMEFVGAHLLYTLTGHRAPLLHHAAQVVQPEGAQRVYVRQMEALYQKGEIPIIVLRNDNLFSSQLYNMPMEDTIWYITEFVYANYTPWLVVDDFQLWKANNADFELFDIDAPDYEVAFTADDSYTLSNAVFDDEAAGGGVTASCGAGASISWELPEPFVTEEWVTRFIRLEGGSDLQGWYDIQLHNTSGYLYRTRAYFANSGAGQTAWAVFPALGNGDALTAITFLPPAGATFSLQSLSIYAADFDNGGLEWGTLPVRDYSLERIPYEWANMDEQIAAHPPETLLELPLGLEVGVGVCHVLNNAAIDKQDGNYVRLTVTNDTGQDQTLWFGYQGNYSAGAAFTVLPGTHQYLIRVSTQYEWYSADITAVYFAVRSVGYSIGTITEEPFVTVDALSVLRAD